MVIRPFLPLALFLCLTAVVPSHADGLAMHGTPKLAPEFSSFPYADKRALQGGKMVQAQYGNFDSLNPFSVRGNVARNLRERVSKAFSSAIMTKPSPSIPCLPKKCSRPTIAVS